MKAYANEGKTAEEIPAELKAAAEEAPHEAGRSRRRRRGTPCLEKYLESGELTNEELMRRP